MKDKKKESVREICDKGIAGIHIEERLLPEQIPALDLYMDQLITLFESSMPHQRRTPDDKLITKPMVNNYIKADILPRARGKKYAREHLVHLSVILRLKQVLSVKDTGALIKAGKQDKTDEAFYENFRHMVESISGEISARVLSEDESMADAAMRLAVESYLCKNACEYLIDRIAGYEDDELFQRSPRIADKK